MSKNTQKENIKKSTLKMAHEQLSVFVFSHTLFFVHQKTLSYGPGFSLYEF